MVEESIKDFVKEFIDSFTSWDILVFYNNNPQMAIDVNELASNIGRNNEDVEQSIINLVNKNILQKKEGQEGIYKYLPEDSIKEKIDEFIEALSHREKRMAILSIILEKGTK